MGAGEAAIVRLMASCAPPLKSASVRLSSSSSAQKEKVLTNKRARKRKRRNKEREREREREKEKRGGKIKNRASGKRKGIGKKKVPCFSFDFVAVSWHAC